MDKGELRYRNTVQSTVFPIVAAVVCKAMYRVEFRLWELEYRARGGTGVQPE